MPNHLRKDTEKGARVINEECFVEALWIAFQPCHASTYLRCQINEVYLHTYEIDTSILDPPMHFLMDAIHRLWNQFTDGYSILRWKCFKARAQESEWR